MVDTDAIWLPTAIITMMGCHFDYIQYTDQHIAGGKPSDILVIGHPWIQKSPMGTKNKSGSAAYPVPLVTSYKILWFTILWGLYNYNSWCSVFYCRLWFLSTSSWPVDIWNLENRVLRIWPYKYRLTKKTFLFEDRWGSWYIYIYITIYTC